MAISYEQVGWDTTTYVNPTNMNQMDDGILAACDGVDELGTEMDTKLDLSGGTMTGDLIVNNTSTYSRIYIGAAGNTRTGILSIYNGDYYAAINPVSLSANQTIRLPNNTGTVALTSDIQFVDYSHEYTVSANGTVYWNPASADGVALSGYTATGILNMKTNDSRMVIANMQVGTSSSYDIILKNISSDSFSATCTYRVMFVKS